MATRFPGQLFVTITGPSGAGKDALMESMVKANSSLALFATATTRAPRKGEREGIDYYFLSKDDFLDKLRRGDILEHNEMLGRYYGTLRSVVEGLLAEGHDVLTDMNSVGMFQVREKMPDNHLSFVILPPSLEALEARIASRKAKTKEDEEYIEQRFAKIREDLRYLDEHPDDLSYKFISADLQDSRLGDFDYVIRNDDLQRTTQEVLEIIEKERKRRKVA